MDIPIDLTHITIETPRLTLRAFTQNDLDDFYQYTSTPGLGEMAGWPHHTNIETSQAVLNRFIKEKDVFAICQKGGHKVIGSLGIHSANWLQNVEAYKHLKAKNIGYVLAKDHWGQGLMPEAVMAVMAYGFANFPIDAFGCEHFLSNPQSGRVIEKCGFTFVTLGTYHAKLLDKHFEEARYILLKENFKTRVKG